MDIWFIGELMRGLALAVLLIAVITFLTLMWKDSDEDE